MPAQISWRGVLLAPALSPPPPPPRRARSRRRRARGDAGEIAAGKAIAAAARERKWQKALVLLSELEAPNIVHYNAAIDACGKSGQWEAALALLREMPHAPDAYSYGGAIGACGKGGQPEAALALLAEMRDEHGLRPNSVVYNSAISACRAAGQWAKALDYEEVRAAGCADAISLEFGARRAPARRPVGGGALAPRRRRGVAAAAARRRQLHDGDHLPPHRRPLGGRGRDARTDEGRRRRSERSDLRRGDLGGGGGRRVGARVRALGRDGGALQPEMLATPAYVAAVSACAAAAQWRQALRLLVRMRRRTSLPAERAGVQRRNLGVRARVAGRRCLGLLRRMVDESVRDAPPPTSVSYNAAISACDAPAAGATACCCSGGWGRPPTAPAARRPPTPRATTALSALARGASGGARSRCCA